VPSEKTSIVFYVVLQLPLLLLANFNSSRVGEKLAKSNILEVNQWRWHIFDQSLYFLSLFYAIVQNR